MADLFQLIKTIQLIGRISEDIRDYNDFKDIDTTELMALRREACQEFKKQLRESAFELGLKKEVYSPTDALRDEMEESSS